MGPLWDSQRRSAIHHSWMSLLKENSDRDSINWKCNLFNLLLSAPSLASYGVVKRVDFSPVDTMRAA